MIRSWSMPCRALVGSATFGVACMLAPPASAQSETSFDTTRSTITGSTRRIGLGGAFVAIADDTDGVGINPASVAVRLPYSWYDWDYGVGLDVAVGAWLPKNDIYNQGDASNAKSTALFGSLSAIAYYRHVGFGVAAEAQRNAATRQDQAQGIATNLSAHFGALHASLAYGFLGGQLLLGAGPRFVGVSLSGSASAAPLAAGVGYEAGLIVKPTFAPYRLAAAVKSPIDARVRVEPDMASTTVHVPWELAFGLAYQFGRRPLNPKFVTVDEVARQRQAAPGAPLSKAELDRAESDLFDAYRANQRWYLLVSSELSLIQAGRDATLAGRAATSRPLVSPRLGLETQIVPDRLRFRAGSYYEPAVTDGAESRVHGTAGFDVRLFEWDIFGFLDPFGYWELSVGGDAARAFLNTSFSLGFWH
jgi:hypothetical protein